MQQNITKFPNFSFATVTQNKERIVYAQISVDIHHTNSAHQQALELLYTDALLSGCGALSRDAFLDSVAMLGASIGVSVSNGVLTITLKSIDSNAKKLFQIFDTMIQKPTFSAGELTRIKKQTLNELKEYKENAKAVAHDNLVNMFYEKSDRRYTHPPATVTTAIAKITRTDLVAVHAQIRTSYWVCSIGGNKEVCAMLEKTLQNCVRKIKKQTETKSHGQVITNTRVTLSNVPSKHNIEFSIGAPLPLTLHHPDFVPFVFGLNVLGKWGGFAGRLMSTVREKEGLTYGIYAQTESVTGDEQGYWRIMTFFAPDKTMQGITSTLREITAIAQKGITADESTRFKNILNTQQTLLVDSLVRMVKNIHGYHFAGFTLKEMKEHKLRMSTVTKDEVNKVLKTYLNAKTLTVSGAGPIKSVKNELTKLLN